MRPTSSSPTARASSTTRAERGLDGLLTLIGVRYTTGPVEAVEAVDLAVARLERPVAPSRIEHEPVHGGGVDDFEALVRGLGAKVPAGVHPRVPRALAHNHGSEADAVLGLVRERPQLGARCPTVRSWLPRSCWRHGRRWPRRSPMRCSAGRISAPLGSPGEAALDAAARLMGDCMGWDQSRRDAEVAYVRSRLQLAATGRALLAESAAAPALVA